MAAITIMSVCVSVDYTTALIAGIISAITIRNRVLSVLYYYNYTYEWVIVIILVILQLYCIDNVCYFNEFHV